MHPGMNACRLWACMQPKYTAKAEDKISEARTKPAQGALNEEASVNRYNAMKAAAAAAVNRCAGCQCTAETQVCY